MQSIRHVTRILLLTLVASLMAIPPSSASSVSINGDSGGSVGTYIRKVSYYQKSGTVVRFTGRCDSACTLLLALPRSKTCIRPGAYFRFHAPIARNSQMQRLTHLLMMKKYPSWVRSYLARKGGLTRNLVTIDYSYASRYLKQCG